MIWVHDERKYVVPQAKVDVVNAKIAELNKHAPTGCCIAAHLSDAMRVLGLDGGGLYEAAEKT